MDITVELKGVIKAFGDVNAVDRVSLQVRRGEFFSLLGPSGCGKTTTLRLIAGFEAPTGGQILINDEDVADKRPYERNVNTVFQSYALFPHLTVTGNIAFGLERKKIPRSHITRQINEALDLVHLEGMGPRYPRQLSGGEQQRVALARALVLRPDVLLLDEPLGALDLKLRKEMQIELKRLQEKVGITFIYVTHDQEEALTMSDRIAVMEKGRLAQVGTPEDIYNMPRTRFVAEFIGVSNFFSGKIAESGQEQLVVETNSGLTVSLPGSENRQKGQPLQFSVRPEKISVISGEEDTEGENRFHGRILNRIFLGGSVTYVISLADDQQVKVDVKNDRRSRQPFPFSSGDHVVVSWHREDGVILAD
ncbi:MAG: ABC transporter ATP-binding protein [Desulfobacterales bacterium]